MDELTVLEVVIVARKGRELWTAEGFFLFVPGKTAAEVIAEEVYAAAMATGRNVLSPPEGWRITTRVQLRVLRGPLAKAMRHHLNRVGGGEAPAFVWNPGNGAVVWTLGDN